MVVIAYEGKSDGEFFNSLLEAYNLPKEVRYYEFKGKDNIFKLGHEHYNEIEADIDIIDKILIVVDADNKNDKNPNRGYTASEKALKQLIEDLDFNIEIKYHIMCDRNKEGYMESFLLSVLDNEQKDCIEKFKNCFKYKLSDKWVYNSFYKHHEHPFDFSHPNFDELKQKLQNLFT